MKWVFLSVLKSVHARKYDASTQSFIVFITVFHLCFDIFRVFFSFCFFFFFFFFFFLFLFCFGEWSVHVFFVSSKLNF